ncbi:MAG: ABC transporter ATP-binding protein [Planctomycetota bacterium]
MVQNTSNGEYAIDLHGVEKWYRGRVQALTGIEMQVRRGEVFGLLGPNGAGKSTLVKIMMSVVRPTRASGTLLDKPVGHKPTLARVGYLPEHHQLPRYLTGAQVLDYYATLAGVDRSQRKQRSGDLLATVGMTDWAERKIGTYSKGMMQRIGLAQALMNEPDLIVLDEPTDGVDPVGRREIRDVLVQLKDRGHTVFLNSHLLSELEMVCDRVSILVQGRVAMQGTLDDLTKDSRRYEIDVLGAAPACLSAFPDARHSTAAERTMITLPSDDSTPVQPLLDRLRSDGITIERVERKRETLEDLFMRAVTDPTTGKAMQPGAAKTGSPAPATTPAGDATSGGAA